MEQLPSQILQDLNPYSQALHLRRICSQVADFRRRTGELKHRLQKRGYQEAEVEKAIQQAMSTRRDDCLQPQARETFNTTTPPSSHPSMPPLGNITYQNQHLLQQPERMRRAVPAPPIIVYCHPKNLHVTSSPIPSPGPGNELCGRPRCKTCPTLMAIDKFTSKTTGKSYDMRSFATCKTANLIYLIQCKICGCQYVGETEQALNERMDSHRTEQEDRKASCCPLQLPGLGTRLLL